MSQHEVITCSTRGGGIHCEAEKTTGRSRTKTPPPSSVFALLFLFRAPSAENDDGGKRYLLSLLHTVDTGRRDHCNPSLPARVLSPNVSGPQSDDDARDHRKEADHYRRRQVTNQPINQLYCMYYIVTLEVTALFSLIQREVLIFACPVRLPGGRMGHAGRVPADLPSLINS